MMVMGECLSTPWDLSCWIPQGSILLPLQFNMYMRSLGETVQRYHPYADDTQFYLFPLMLAVQPVLSQRLATVGIWRQVDQLKWNPDKTEVMTVGRQLALCEVGGLPNSIIDGVQIPLVT